MIVTEEEAKTKWCPEANAHGDSMLRGVTRDSDRNWQHTLCIGAACMAWREVPLIVNGSIHEIGAPRKGYCGKAGKP